MTTRKPAPEQIAAEVTRLKAVQPLVPPHSLFGDDNRAAIDAQIKVLEDRLSLDDVHDAYGEDSVEREISQNTLDAAIEANDWMNGLLTDGEDTPAAGWEALAK